METILTTYKFYDDRGRRLSIFAIPEKRGDSDKPIDVLKIYVITCSKKDNFSKKKGKRLFEDYRTFERMGSVPGEIARPLITTIPVEEKGKFKKAFKQYINDNYSKLYESFLTFGIPIASFRIERGNELGGDSLSIKYFYKGYNGYSAETY